LLRHCALLSKLKPAHVSPDKPADPDNPDCRKFHIIEARWQSKAYKTFMRDIDKKSAQSRANKSGNKRRERIELAIPETINSEAPVGLWRNCYDVMWLKSLEPHEFHALEVIEDEYDFSLEYRTESL
ncbi:hypothetical protein C8Q80DRAFT_1113287, partial [Daedaleopsis nitida]